MGRKFRPTYINNVDYLWILPEPSPPATASISEGGGPLAVEGVKLPQSYSNKVFVCQLPQEGAYGGRSKDCKAKGEM